MTKTWVGLGDGSGEGLGNVRIDGDDDGLECVCAELRPPHAVSTTSVVTIADKRWAVEIRPERGGRITSLRLDGEELLDQGIGVDQPTAKGFVEGGAFGWDEMVPNLEPTDVLPDHGEAWRVPWEVVDDRTLRAHGRLVPWRLERRIDAGESLLVTYVYVNDGDSPHRAFWCAHPLFRYDPDMDVSTDVPRPKEGRSAKVFLPAGSIDRVRLGRVQIRWDAALTPDVAIWVCNGDLGGYRQIAVEPGFNSRQIAAGASISWWLEISAL